MVLLWISGSYNNAGEASTINYTPWKILNLMQNMLGILAKFKSNMGKDLLKCHIDKGKKCK